MLNPPIRYRRRRAALSARGLLLVPMLLCMTSVLVACSGSSSTPGGGVVSAQEEDTRVPAGLLQLADEPGLLVGIPAVLLSVTTAQVGVQVAYTRLGQTELVPAELVEANWLSMQQCLGQSGASPIVMVRDGAFSPFTALDDVIFDIDGIPVASASRRTVPILQVRESDFDVALSNPGFNLRAIMGRVLWLSASLSERDYPYECARRLV